MAKRETYIMRLLQVPCKKDIDSHLERCSKLKAFEIAQDRKRAEVKEEAEIEHSKRLKRLAGYLKTPTPSRSSGKSKMHSSWRVIIPGGAVETNPAKIFDKSPEPN